jgi:hypothetical protein
MENNRAFRLEELLFPDEPPAVYIFTADGVRHIEEPEGLMLLSAPEEDWPDEIPG